MADKSIPHEIPSFDLGISQDTQAQKGTTSDLGIPHMIVDSDVQKEAAQVDDDDDDDDDDGIVENIDAENRSKHRNDPLKMEILKKKMIDEEEVATEPPMLRRRPKLTSVRAKEQAGISNESPSKKRRGGGVDVAGRQSVEESDKVKMVENNMNQ